MADISTDWRTDGVHTVTTGEGRSIKIAERGNGIAFTNERNETWFLPHVESVGDGTADILVAGVKFRPVPA